MRIEHSRINTFCNANGGGEGLRVRELVSKLVAAH